jgi:hypothetical protein
MGTMCFFLKTVLSQTTLVRSRVKQIILVSIDMLRSYFQFRIFVKLFIFEILKLAPTVKDSREP